MHPFILAYFPILSVYASNILALTPSVLIAPLVFLSVFVTCLLIVSYIIFRNWHRSFIFSSFSIVIFYLYKPLDNLIAIHSVSLLILSAALVAFGLWLFNSKSKLEKAHSIMNRVSLILLFMTLLTATYLALTISTPANDIALKNLKPDLVQQDNPPDIFYIVLDGYASDQIAKEIYQINNSEFTSYLNEIGFYHIENSLSNYSQTALSLASSLNFNYLDVLLKNMNAISVDKRGIRELIQNSLVGEILKEQNYQINAVSSGYSFTELYDENYHGPNKWGVFSEFTGFTTLDTTWTFFLGDFLNRFHCNTVETAFTYLENYQPTNHAQFNFVHIVSPHPPFIFTPEDGCKVEGKFYGMIDGNHLTDAEGFSSQRYIQEYSLQHKYITAKLLTALKSIQTSKQGKEAIIIIQSDHGPAAKLNWDKLDESALHERMSITNAIYLPEAFRNKVTQLPSDISPVNTFRIILNSVFNAELPLLENKHYFSTINRPFELHTYHPLDTASQNTKSQHSQP